MFYEIVKPGTTSSRISLEYNTESPTQENSKYECGPSPLLEALLED